MTRRTSPKSAKARKPSQHDHRPPPKSVLSAHSALDEVRDSSAARLTIAGCTTAVFLALGWASQVEVDEKVTGSGTIEHRGQVERIEHPYGGVVSSLVAYDNAILDPGAVVLSFETDQLEREALGIAARIVTLEGEAERVQFLLNTDGTLPAVDRILGDAASEAFWAEQVFLLAQLERIETENARLSTQIDSAETRAEIIKSESGIVRDQIARYDSHLDQGTIRLLDRERLQREALQLTRSLEEIEGRRKELEGTRQENLGRRHELLAQRRRDAAVRWTKIDEELVTLRQTAAEIAARIDRAIVRTTVGGQVHRLEISHPNEVVAPGDLIAEIVPPGSNFRAVVMVSADHIGDIRPGIDVTLKVVSYDFTRFGSISAQVSDVSPTSFINDQGQVVYNVTVDLPPSVAVGDAEVAVRPGMTVTADILTGQRTILSYLLHPVRRIQDQSLSET